MENTSLLDINKELYGKRVLVTGGTKGIGISIVNRLFNVGATIITTARTMLNDLPNFIETFDQHQKYFYWVSIYFNCKKLDL